MKTVAQTLGLSHTALNVTDITHAHGEGGGFRLQNISIHKHVSAEQTKYRAEQTKYSEDVGGGGMVDKGPHKKPHNKQLDWNKLDVQQYKMYTNGYVQ